MLFGVSAVSKELNFRQNTMCQKCGKYSSVSVYMMYSTFSIFAPLFKWGKKMKISRLVVSAVSFAVSAALLTLSIIDMFQNDEY